MSKRSPEEIFKSHLQLRLKGNVEEDIQQNYAENVVIITRTTTYYGHDGVRRSAKELDNDIPQAKFSYKKQVVEKNVGYLIWNAESQDKEVHHGTDSFLITKGKIQVQTIYYDVDPKG